MSEISSYNLEQSRAIVLDFSKCIGKCKDVWHKSHTLGPCLPEALPPSLPPFLFPHFTLDFQGGIQDIEWGT